MWMMVLFDLPVGTKKQRRVATKFRHTLLDAGFDMSQFSVYLRHCSGKEQAASLTTYVGKNLPSTGRVHIVYFTDKQYENILCFDGRTREDALKNPSQLALF